MSFVTTWTKEATIRVPTPPQYEEHTPHCSYVLVRPSTVAASKTSIDTFMEPSGEQSSKLVPNSMLLSCDSVIPSKYHCLVTKVSVATKCFKLVVPSHPIKELVQTTSLQVDEQEAKGTRNDEKVKLKIH